MENMNDEMMDSFEVIETDDIEAPDIELDAEFDAEVDILDERTLDEVYEEALHVIADTRVELVTRLANATSETQTLWRTEKTIASAIVAGTATEQQIAVATEAATAGGDTIEDYATKVLAKAQMLEEGIVMKAAALVRDSHKSVESAYEQAKTLDTAAGIELIESTLSQKLEAAYSLVS